MKRSLARNAPIHSRSRAVLVVMLAASFSLIAAGCGGSQGESEGPVKVGVILPYSGVYAQLGEDITDAMELYVEEQNGELAGREIELVTEDTEADPQTGVQAARTLLEREDVDFLTGAVSTSVAYGVIDLAEREQVPFVISNALGNDATRQGSDYVFRTSGNSWQVTYPMGEYLVEQGREEIFVSAADYAAGNEMAEDFKAGFTQAGGEVVGEAYPELGTNDYSSYLTNIENSSADASWSFFAGSDAVSFVQQFDEFGLHDTTQLYGTGNLVGIDTLEAQGSAAEGAQTALFYSPDLDNPENDEFKSSFQDSFDREPGVYAVQGWDAAWLIGEAVRSTEGDTEDPEAMIEAMENVEFESPRGPMELDENHNPVHNIYIREAQEQDDGSVNNVVVDTIEDVEDPGE